MEQFTSLALTKTGSVATLAFDRPEHLNSFDSVMRRSFVAAAQYLEQQEDIEVVVLTGNGRAFGAGADLAEQEEGLNDGASVQAMLESEYKPGVLAIGESTKTWIAAVNGPCAGISVSYAMACDLCVIADSAFLYQPFAAIGLVPDGGATWLLPQRIGTLRAFELMILGEKVRADKALEWGLVNRVFTTDSFADDVAEFAADVAGRSPLARRYTKQALRAATGLSLSDTISYEAELQKLCIDSEDCSNAIAAFLKKETPTWRGR